MNDVVVEHSEYIGDVISSSSASTYANAVIGLSNSTYPQLQLNAGNSITFPWLSGIAGAFIHYEFEALSFEFQSTSATALNSTNTNLGIIACRCEINPTLPIDANLSALLNTHGHMKRMPYESWHYAVPCKGMRYVRTSQGTPANNWNLTTTAPVQDIRNYDLGWFNIATTGMQGTSVNLGQLHVHYKVRLIRPLIGVYPSSLQASAQFWSNGAVTASAPLTGLVASNTIPPGLTFTFTTTTFTFPASVLTGYWMFEYWFVGAAGTLGNFTLPTVTNSTIVTGLLNNTQQALYAPVNAIAQTGAARFMAAFIVLVTGAGATVNLTNINTSFTTATNINVNISKINPNVVGGITS